MNGVVLGAGVMIGAISVYLYQHFVDRCSRLMLKHDINQLSLSVSDIRKELNILRKQMRNIMSRSVIGVPSLATDAETELFSAMGGDEVDDEFYDFSSDNDNVTEESKTSFAEIDSLLEGISQEDKTKAYGLLLELLEKDSENVETLWRLAKACHMMSSIYGEENDTDKKKEYLNKGVEYGQKAIDINDTNWNAHKWFAICIGGRGQLQSVKDRLHDGHVFKAHLDTAIAINPQDATLHHILGRIYYEVSTLTWLERKVATTLFGKVPEGTCKDAIDSFLEAEKLNATAWKENRLLLGKCYIAEHKYDRAVYWLDSANEIPAVNAEDQKIDKEIDSLLKKYNSYKVSNK